jgi:tetratricopeptide (TPR) repeat protein
MTGEAVSSAAIQELRAGLIHLRREQLPEGLAALDAALAIDPDLADAHAYRSAALVALGRPEEAREASARALELRPDDFGPRMKAGELALRLGHLSLANEHFLAAVRAAVPGSPDEAAAKAALIFARKREGQSISHRARLPRLPRWRRPAALLDRASWRSRREPAEG